MKVLVVGAGGMLGHQLVRRLSSEVQVYGTVRNSADVLARCSLPPGRIVPGVDANDFDRVVHAVGAIRPDVVINCVGVIKQVQSAKNPLTAIAVNSILPHRLANLCGALGARFVHISTDCVFSGLTGMYNESDRPDAVDLYGRSKLLGEVTDDHCLTLRTSIIGRELATKNGLVEWFLQTKAREIDGFRRAIFSGLTTLELARVIENCLRTIEALSGIYHVSANPITKRDLLELIREGHGLVTIIRSVDEPVIDRSLDSTKFRAKLQYEPPSWPKMIQELADDRAFYE